MLEACICVHPKANITLKSRGDILAVALTGFEWGVMDRKYHQIIEWEDADLEEEVRNDPRGIIELPYSTFDAEGQVIVRSVVRVDLESIDSKKLKEVMDSTKPAAALLLHEFATTNLAQVAGESHRKAPAAKLRG